MRVRLEDVAVRFGEVVALDGVDLTLRPGCVHVLAGPNGAGKSTLIGVLLGLVRPDRGTLWVDDERHDLARRLAPRTLRERLGYLPESVAFAETLTGREVLTFFARARGVARDRVDATLDRVGLGNAARRAVRGYSRGMRQRLGLAVALIAEPRLLVLDEPTGGLDQEGLSLLWSVLAASREAGRCVVVSTHDLALIERRADEIAVLSEGRQVALGSVASLRHEVALPRHLVLTCADAEGAAGVAAGLRERGWDDAIHDDAVVRVRIGPADLVDAVRAVDDLGVEVVTTQVDEPGLDDVYEALLARAS